MKSNKSSRKLFSILPQEIVWDILSWLSVKSLLRMKCVCKLWLSLISDHQFARIQLQRTKSDDRFNLRRVFLTTSPLQSVDYEAFCDGIDSDDVSLQLGYPVREIPEYDDEIAGFCNGLLCIVFDYNQMVLWNPTTLVSRELPASSDSSPDHQGIFFYGFRFVVSVDDYKVIGGVISTGKSVSRETKVEVLSLKKNSWKKIQYLLNSNVDIHGTGILSDDSLHWLGIQGSDSNKKYAIVSFDLSNERFKENVSLPDHLDQDIYTANMGILGDRLVLFCDRSGIQFEALEMKEYGIKASWSKLFNVSSDLFPEYESFPTLIGFTKDGKVLLEIDGRELVLYCTREEKFRNFVVNDDWDRFEAVIYEESLVSPNFAEENTLKFEQNNQCLTNTGIDGEKKVAFNVKHFNFPCLKFVLS